MRWTAIVTCLALAVASPAPAQDVTDLTEEGMPRLGVVVMGMTRDLRGYFGAPPDRGVLIAHVESGSIAQMAGFLVGDVVIRVADRRIDVPDDVTRALAAQPGGRIRFYLVREGQPMQLDAIFPERKPAL